MGQALTKKLDKYQLKERANALRNANVPKIEEDFILSGKIPPSLKSFWKNRRMGITPCLKEIITIALPNFKRAYDISKDMPDLSYFADKSFQNQVENLILKGIGNGLKSTKDPASILKQVRSAWGRTKYYSANTTKVKNKGARNKDFLKQIKIAKASKNKTEAQALKEIAKHLREIGVLINESSMANAVNSIASVIENFHKDTAHEAYFKDIIKDLLDLGERAEEAFRLRESMKSINSRLFKK